MDLRRFLCAAILVALVLGCNKSEGPGSGDPSSAGGASADAPDVALKNSLAALTTGDASAAWNMLPDKHQADAKAVWQEAAGKVDAEVWNRSFVVLGKLAELLKTKKDYILGSSVLGMKPEDKEEVARVWPHAVEVVDALANTEIKTVDGFKASDPGKFLSTTGTKVLTALINGVDKVGPAYSGELKSMKNYKVTLVKQEGDTATVKTETDDAPAKEVTLQRVGGKWVPADLLKEWDDYIGAAKNGLSQAAMTPEMKQQVLPVLAMVEGALDGLLKAKDQNEFDATLAPIMALARTAMPMAGPPGAGGPVGLGGPSLTGPGTLPTPGTLPKPSGTITGPSPVGPSLPGTTPAANPALPAGGSSTGPALQAAPK